jgi:putative membrane protein
MALDWGLASIHHLAIFALAAILAYELALTGGEVNARAVLRLTRVDSWYGAMAAVVLAAGVARVFLGEKGPEYYAANTLFWIKMALFASIAAVSVLPTLRYLYWRREALLDPDFLVERKAVASVRAVLWVEVALFALMPIAAAGMARGFGS